MKQTEEKIINTENGINQRCLFLELFKIRIDLVNIKGGF